MRPKSTDPELNWLPWLIMLAVVAFVVAMLIAHPGGE
jgi:hypothetical protein